MRCLLGKIYSHSLYVTEIKEKPILKRIKVATPHFCHLDSFKYWFFFYFVIVLTLDFWYMIKTKEATESVALEFCHILNKFAAHLDECLSFKVFCLKRSFRASFRRKLGGSAICSKCEQNSTAVLSVAYLFFIIYSKSTVGHYKI